MIENTLGIAKGHDRGAEPDDHMHHSESADLDDDDGIEEDVKERPQTAAGRQQANEARMFDEAMDAGRQSADEHEA